MTIIQLSIFSFHGDTHSIFLEGEKGDEAVLTLSDLARLSDGVLKTVLYISAVAAHCWEVKKS